MTRRRPRQHKRGQERPVRRQDLFDFLSSIGRPAALLKGGVGLGSMHRSDAELMARWQRGDGAAFATLVRRWQQPMARFLVHAVGRPDMVNDLVQEVFLRVHGAAGRYREEGTFSTWLYRIALNVARDAVRRRRREPLPLADSEPMAATPAPDEVCQRREAARLVAEAVAALPAALREVLVLRHYEGLGFEEIARLTGTPASTLKSRFAAALLRLRARLRELGYDEKDTNP
jgi:RNA polymerase sigma-70 factor (ECF subfamily)